LFTSPGRARSHSNADRGLAAFGNEHKWRLDVDRRLADGINDLEDERRREVSWSQIDDSKERRARDDGSVSESEIVGDHHAAVLNSTLENAPV
jgi:hypothetical protein